MPDYLTIEEVCEVLRSSEKSVYEWMRSGKLRAGRAGRRWLITRADVDAFVAGGGAYGGHNRPPVGGPDRREDPAVLGPLVAATLAFIPPASRTVNAAPLPPADLALVSTPGANGADPPLVRSNANPLVGMQRNKNKRGR